jgi:hypothetical protein
MMNAKSLKEKSWEAYEWELSNRHETDGRRKPYGIKPLYHYYFGPYLLWLVTGKWTGTAKSTNAEEASKELYREFGFGMLESEVIPFLQQLLAQDTDPLLFNPYRYLLEKLEEENKYLKDDSTQLHRIRHWLTDAMHTADIQAKQFHPATYNIAAQEAASVTPQMVDAADDDASHTTAEAPQPVTENQVSPFDKLLLGYSLAELTTLLFDLKLIGKDERATTSASPGAWVGVIYALLDEKSPRIRGSKSSIQRAFYKTFGAVVSERSVQDGITKSGSEAEDFRTRALAYL